MAYREGLRRVHYMIMHNTIYDMDYIIVLFGAFQTNYTS